MTGRALAGFPGVYLNDRFLILRMAEAMEGYTQGDAPANGLASAWADALVDGWADVARRRGLDLRVRP